MTNQYSHEQDGNSSNGTPLHNPAAIFRSNHVAESDKGRIQSVQALKGNVAVITGAASGIGRALALQMASHGALLALADIDASGLEETRQLCHASAKTYVVDVSDESSMDRFAARVGAELGKVTILVNNAGVALRGTFIEVSQADMEWLFGINFWGVVYGCRSFLPLLLREPQAQIVNMSSVFGLVGLPGQAAYSASKFAVRGFTEVLRHELKDSNVGITCVYPGGIRTSIAANARSGALVTADATQAILRFEKLARTIPVDAARAIMNGILKKKAKIVIGADAYAFDALQRLLPVAGSNLISSVSGLAAKRNG